MKLFGYEFGRKKKPPVAVEDKKQPEAKTVDIIKLQRVGSPILSYKPRTGTNVFEWPEYDLAEVGKISDVETYVARAFAIKEGLMFKQGYEFVGKNPKTIQYIKERFRQIAMVTGIPTKLLFKRIGAGLIRFSNSYICKVRKQESSGGRSRKLQDGQVIPPVAGYFPIPPAMIRIFRDDNGKPIVYKQFNPIGKHREFPANQIIHFYMYRKEGFLVGTPILTPVKDDIRALRRIEQNVELLVYQHLFPLYHYKVGTEKAPAATYPNGMTEVDVVKQELEIMPSEGAIVTPERHEITSIGAEGKALRVEGIMNHFRERVFAGLAVSSIDMGQGGTANRSTADTMSRNLVDDVKAIQFDMEAFVNFHMIIELLLESTFSDPISEDNIVRLKFNEIDIDTKVKVENHAINSFKGYAITLSELRKQFGHEPHEEADWQDSYWKKIEEPKMLISAVDEPFLSTYAALDNPNIAMDPEHAAAAALKREKEGVPTQVRKVIQEPAPNAGQRAAEASDKPSNQHGQKLSPEKRKSSRDSVSRHTPVNEVFDALLDNIKRSLAQEYFGIDWMRMTCSTAGNLMKTKVMNEAKVRFYNGVRASGIDPLNSFTEAPLQKVQDKITKSINEFINKIIGQVSMAARGKYRLDPNMVDGIFGSLDFLCHFIYDTETRRAGNYGYAVGLKAQGYETAEVVTSDKDCEICNSQKKSINLDELTIYDVPCYHSNCKCSLKKPE